MAQPGGASPQYRTLSMANLIQEVYGEVYTPMQASGLYLASGITDGWVYGELVALGFPIELKPKGYPYFILPEDEIIPTWEENKPAALYLINGTQLPETLSPDIKANASDGPLIIPQGENADWWVAANSPFGRYWYTLDNGWVRSDPPIRVYGGPLFNLSPYEVLNSSGLPIGIYKFHFGVDLLMNGYLDFGELYFDRVDVTIEGEKSFRCLFLQRSGANSKAGSAMALRFFFT